MRFENDKHLAVTEVKIVEGVRQQNITHAIDVQIVIPFIVFK